MKQRQRPKIQVETGYRRMFSKDSDDSGEETELFIKKPQHQEIPTVEKVVEDGDTLQALSIRYHCPISELKRLNNIHRENEIFAKRIIRVPARPFSMALASIHTSGSNSPDERNGSVKKGVDAEILKSKLNDKFLNIPSTTITSSSNDSAYGAIEVNQVIFNSNVKPVLKVCDNLIENPLINAVDDEEISLLPRTPPAPETVVSRLSCSGADADISWIALIICIVIVIFAVPLIYIFYIAEHFEQYHNSLS